MVKFTDDLLVTQVFGICFKYAKTIEEITYKVYKNYEAKNIVRIYKCCQTLMKHEVLKPKIQNNELKFQVDQDILKK